MLGYQNAILLAISHISLILLQSTSRTFEKDLLRAMEIMAAAAEVDRVYIWENSIKNGEPYASQVYEWSINAEPQQDTDLVKNVSYKNIMPTWWRMLSNGDCVNGLVKELSNEKELLSAQGILSILVVPIFFHDQFWGFVGFDDCHSERAFSKNEERILRSASELITNSLIRNHIYDTTLTAEQKVVLDNAMGRNLEKFAFDSLSGQEIRLAELIMQGYTNPEIAKILNITDNTVRHYRKSLYSKLQIHSRRELFELAERKSRRYFNAK